MKRIKNSSLSCFSTFLQFQIFMVLVSEEKLSHKIFIKHGSLLLWMKVLLMYANLWKFEREKISFEQVIRD